MAALTKRRWHVQAEFVGLGGGPANLLNIILTGPTAVSCRKWVSQKAEKENMWVLKLSIQEIDEDDKPTGKIRPSGFDQKVVNAGLLPAPAAVSKVITPYTYKAPPKVKPLAELRAVTFTIPEVKIIEEVIHDQDT